VSEGRFNCDCMDKLDETLEPSFYHADRSLMFNMKGGFEWEVMLIPLGKYDPPKGTKRPKQPRIIMKYCPICGTQTGERNW
jgi:hypothetical protein